MECAFEAYDAQERAVALSSVSLVADSLGVHAYSSILVGKTDQKESGRGSQTLSMMYGLLKKLDVVSVYAHISVRNEASIHLHEKFPFTIIKEALRDEWRMYELHLRQWNTPESFEYITPDI